MAGWGSLQLKGKTNYERFDLLQRIVAAGSIFLLVNFAFDTVWLVAEGLKFAYLFEQGWQEILMYLARNIAGFIFCLLIALPYIKAKVIGMTLTAEAFILVMMVFFAFWFHLAPGMEYTDWTYAVRHGFSGQQILKSFLISHVIGKLLQGGLFISLWQKD